MKIKLLTANTAISVYGMDKLLWNLRAHIAFHGWKILFFLMTGNLFSKILDFRSKESPRRIRFLEKHSSISHILKLIDSCNPDVFVLNELIFQMHKDPLEDALTERGYHVISWGESLHHPDATLATVIVSRLSVTPKKLRFLQLSQMGGGAGIAALQCNDYPLTIIGFHCAHKLKKIITLQLQEIANIVEKEHAQGRSVILAGDFNQTEKKISRNEAFRKLDMYSVTSLPTCPTCVPKIFQKSLDHIFIPKTSEVLDVSYYNFGSDHLAVMAEVQL